MPLGNWITVTESQFPWELEALDFIRQGFPTRDPFRAWSNFEFIADDGSINEVDLLVLTPQGFFLVEIKSQPGTLRGDAGTWTWECEGRLHTGDSPVLSADRKAKKLRSLLERQKVTKKLKDRLPFIEPLVFCSAENIQCNLPGNARYKVCLRDRDAAANRPQRPGIMAAILRRECPGLDPNPRGHVDRPMAKAIGQAMEQAGIRPSQKSRKISDFVLNNLLMEGPGFQDWQATHVKLEEVKRRIRVYLVRQGASEADRKMIERAALREFQLLETLQHPGILRTHGFTEHELGSALILEHFPKSVRLDHYLAQRGERLAPDVRLDLLRQIADVVRFAHDKRVVHRALSPQSILVVDLDSDRPKIKVFNWHVGYRGAGSAVDASRGQITATAHIDRLVEDSSTAYLAPEAFLQGEDTGEHLDIFSLGAVAYHLFSGQPPAANALELAEKLRESKGLQISSVLNGAGENLQFLIQFSTHPDVANRIDSVRDILELLDEVQAELLESDHDTVDDPLAAAIGDKLPGGLIVKKVLGTGASSKALLVDHDGQEAVLKVASAAEHNQRLLAEGEVLQKLRHQHIVEHYQTLEIGGRVCLLMSRAGTETLGDRLTKQGRLHAGLLHRFGEDLLQVVAFLEEQGISHRDIKPHNIGVGKVGRGDKLHLLLFDFSLSRVTAENIRAGTVGYLDPFLIDRKPPRWDLHAERYAAAITLYELATGLTPKWGDGKSDPALLDCQVTIESELFDASVRDRLSDFFTQALRRDPQQRFDNAEDMLRAWRSCFEGIEERPTTDHTEWDDLAARLRVATFDTPVAELGLSSSALDALDRKNVLTVADLLSIKPGRLKRMSGIVGGVRRQILEVANLLRARLGAPPKSGSLLLSDSDNELPPQPAGTCSVDSLIARIIRGNSAGRDETERQFLLAFLGLDPGLAENWPSQADLAPYLGLTRGQVSQLAVAGCTRWRRDAWITTLRNDIFDLIQREGGVLSVQEIATAVLLTRGSVEDEPVRSRQALAVTRAAIETERTLAEPRVVVRRDGRRILVAISEELADYAARLGGEADLLAAQDPLATPARALDHLRSVRLPAGVEPLAEARLLRTAATASQQAALSSRQELYPRGMDAERALKLSQGALLGAAQLTMDDVRNRVTGRYPDAAPLPDRPALDDLLRSAGFEFQWDQSIKPRGAYRLPTLDPLLSSHASTLLRRRSTELGEPGADITPDVAEARQFEERLRRAIADGTFIAMTVEPRNYGRAIEECQRFGIETVNVEAEFLRALRDVATEKKVKWDRVLLADAKPGSEDWGRLMQLIRQSAPRVEAAVRACQKPVLLIYPGLLARYEQMELLTRLREQAGRAGGLAALWMLIPSDAQSTLPVMDGNPIPVIGPAEWARIPESWLLNTHRGPVSQPPAEAPPEP